MMIDQIIKNALIEDLGDGDHSSLSCISPTQKGKAKLLAKEDGIIAGVEVAKRVFEIVDPKLTLEVFIKDGSKIKSGEVIFTVSGSSQSILKAERLVLNIMQRMSGIATQTNTLINLLKGVDTKILDTRKTTPNFRVLEKLAVKIGGGFNHRFGLYDMIMLKDNHIDYSGGITKAVEKTKNYLRENKRNLKIEVECRNLEDVKEVLAIEGVDRIMLDNFTVPQTKKAVALINGKIETESSGMITEKTIREYAECGVTYISVGKLTHHIKSLDLSLKAI